MLLCVRSWFYEQFTSQWKNFNLCVFSFFEAMIWNYIISSSPQCYPSKFFPAIQSYCSCLSVVLHLNDSRSTLLRLDLRKKFGRVSPVSRLNQGLKFVSCTIVKLSNFFWRRRPLSRQGRPTGIRITGSGIFRARGGGLLDHPYAPHHPTSAPPTGSVRG